MFGPRVVHHGTAVATMRFPTSPSYTAHWQGWCSACDVDPYILINIIRMHREGGHRQEAHGSGTRTAGRATPPSGSGRGPQTHLPRHPPHARNPAVPHLKRAVRPGEQQVHARCQAGKGTGLQGARSQGASSFFFISIRSPSKGGRTRTGMHVWHGRCAG